VTGPGKGAAAATAGEAVRGETFRGDMNLTPGILTLKGLRSL
jgi:hypothetical protein